MQNATTKWDPTTDFYNFVNYGLFADGGDCYGFSSTSILYFLHYEMNAQTDPYYPQPTSSLNSFPGQTNTDTLTQVTFPIYIHQHFDPNNLLTSSPNEATNIALLKSTIQSGSPVILLMGPTDGHAIVAWGYTESANGSVRIDVSDPNFGNVGRYAYYSDGHFSYTGLASSGSYTWTAFSAAIPGPLQWSWLTLSGTQVGQWSTVVNETNPYYTYIFSDAPITIVGPSGSANFTIPGDSESFTSSIPGVVGFEEGSIQVYGIPIGLGFTISDPGQTSSSVVVVVPQNETSIVGYELTSTSATPLNATIRPTSTGVSVSTKANINLSVGAFSIGAYGRSVVNATAIPVSGSQSAVLSVPDWSNLNSTQSAPSIQVFNPTSSVAVASYTLVNAQQSPPAKPSSLDFLPVALVISAVVVIAGGLIYMRQRKTGPQDEPPS